MTGKPITRRSPAHLREAVVKKFPHLADRLNVVNGKAVDPPDQKHGKGRKPVDPDAPPKKRGKRNPKGGEKVRVGKLSMDSKTEAEVYRELLLEPSTKIIFKGGVCQLVEADDYEDCVTLCPDFIVVEGPFVDPQTGAPDPTRFVGRVVDAKASWAKNGKPHIERDFKVKCRVFKDKTGVEVTMRVPNKQQSSNKKG